MTRVCPCAEEDGATLKQLNPPFNGEAVWRVDNTCSYCGSMNPDAFMERLEAGDIQLDPTDKSYKVYVKTQGITGKFYFQHLSADQRKRFIELNNAGRLNFGPPGYFYMLPFFCRVEPKASPVGGA